MYIAEFIQSQLLPRLRQHGALVVYDAERCYRELCLGLASETLVVVDTSESSIESHEAALAALQRLGTPGSAEQGLLVYVPTTAPHDDDACQHNPVLYARRPGRPWSAATMTGRTWRTSLSGLL